MHRLLKRQLKKVYGKEFDTTTLDEEVQKLLLAVEQQYEAYDKERGFLEHTIQVNSEELTEAYQTIEEHNTSLKDEMSEKDTLLEQYQDAIDATLIVSKTNTEGTITYANQNFCNISGYTKEELIGVTCSIFDYTLFDVYEGDNETTYHEISQLIQHKKTWEGILHNRSKIGKDYYTNTTIFPLVSRQGEILEYLIIRHDITKRIESEKLLEKSKRYSQTLFNDQENIVITMDKTRGVLEANQNFLDTFGRGSLEEFKEQYHCIDELFVEKEGYLSKSDATGHWVDRLILHPQTQFKVILKNRAHKEIVCSVSAKEIEFDDNTIIIVSFTDISELELAIALAEASVRSKNEFMANMSHEIRTPMNGIVGFTDLLLQSSLNAKQKQYATLIKHSIQTLLGIINDVLDFSKIESGNLELDITEVNPFIDLNNSMTIFSSKAKEKGIQFRIDIDSKISTCLFIDKLRITQILSNLINNAIKFTREGGSVSVEMRHIHRYANREKIYFCVSDTGIGIAPEKIENIFHSFVQADVSTTRNYGGTGLGLSISSSLCQLMGTTLQVESQKGKGSKFFFELEVGQCNPDQVESLELSKPPLYVVQDVQGVYKKISQQLTNFKIKFETVTFYEVMHLQSDGHIIVLFHHAQYHLLADKRYPIILIDNQEEAHQLSIDNELIYHIWLDEESPSLLYNAILQLNMIDHQKVTSENDNQEINKLQLSVLVAEDNEVNQILIEEILTAYGVTIVFANNGVEALEKALERHYDMIFMDIHMPKLNGVEATKRIREHGIDVPIIALTANALEGDKEYYLTQGMNDYISKPIDIVKLQEILILYASKTDQLSSKSHSKDKKEEEKQIEEIMQSILSSKEKMHFSIVIMKRLFTTFVQSSYESLEALLKAVEQNDSETIKSKAHSIRGSALSLSFTEIGELCNTLEYEEEVDYANVAKELEKKIRHLYHHKNTILAKLTDLE
jgi:PAS domain S-box-containing protein